MNCVKGYWRRKNQKCDLARIEKKERFLHFLTRFSSNPIRTHGNNRNRDRRAWRPRFELTWYFRLPSLTSLWALYLVFAMFISPSLASNDSVPRSLLVALLSSFGVA